MSQGRVTGVTGPCVTWPYSAAQSVSARGVAVRKERFAICVLVTCVFLATLVSAQQTITVGFTVSKTGSLNVDSLEQYRGFELWRDQTNAAGGIKAGGKSYQVQLVSY